MFPIPSGYEDFCKPTRYCESNNPEIKKLAENISKNKKTQRGASIALFNWVRDNIRYDLITTLSAREILENKSTLCVGKTNLFIALCRAIGIPARYVMFKGNLKSPRKDIVSNEARHTAAEIYVNNKWIITDPAFEKAIEKMFETSKFGIPTWTKWKDVKRVKSLPMLFHFFQKLFFLFSPEIRKARNILKEIRNQ
jgi:transglutaminase-like putative cysteine protease